MGNKLKQLCVMFALALLFCAVPGCGTAEEPVEYELAAGDAVVISTGLESGTVAFLGLADMKKWQACADAGDIDGKLRVEHVCTSLGGGCRLKDGVRGEVRQREGEFVQIIVGARLWWVREYALKRAD